METMTLKTAEAMYDVKVKTLRLMCLRGQIESVRVGKHRYVKKESMDQIFKGIVPLPPPVLEASKRNTCKRSK